MFVVWDSSAVRRLLWTCCSRRTAEESQTTMFDD